MALTVTNAISSQSVGTSTNKGEGKFAQKITLQATTATWSLNVSLTLGTTGSPVPDPGARIRIWYAPSSMSITAAAAVTNLRSGARSLDILPGCTAGDVTMKGTDAYWTTGGYLYLWCDVPTFPVAATLSVDTVEMPLAAV